MLALFLATIEDDSLKLKFEDIYYTYKDDMLNIIFSILKNERESEEALSNAFFAISKSLDKIAEKEENQLKPIICKIARNAAINLYNKNKKSKLVSLDALFNLSDSGDIDENLESSETYNKVLATLCKMPATYRDVLYLYYVNGFSQREICLLLGRNINTVKSQLRRGRKLLRDCFSEVKAND